MPDPSGVHRVFSPSTFSGVHLPPLDLQVVTLSPIAVLTGSFLPLVGRGRVRIFARTLQLFNRSPQALHRRSFSSTPPSSPSLNASRANPPLGDHSRSVSADYNRLRMAFSVGASNSAGGGAPAELGPELSDVYTDVCRPA